VVLHEHPLLSVVIVRDYFFVVKRFEYVFVVKEFDYEFNVT